MRIRPRVPIVALAVTGLLAQQAAFPTQAEARNALAVGIAAGMFGAIVGSAIAQSRPRYQQRPVAKRRPATKAVSQQAANATTQRALAGLGLYDGPQNGKLDQPTKLAIGRFQQQIGQKPTGALTAQQRRTLLTTYIAKVNGAPAAQPAQVSPLFALLGVGSAAAAGSAVAPVAAAANPAAPAPVETPAFFRSVCDSGIGQATSTIPARLTPMQFCTARNTAMIEAHEALSSLGQVDIAAIRTECSTIAQSSGQRIGALMQETPAAVAQRALREFAGAAAQRDVAVTNFKVCLGVGYVEDRPDIVLASALSLVGNGQPGYGELIAGVLGIGQAPYANPVRAAEWLDFTAQAIDKGAKAIANELGDERALVLRAAAAELKAPVPPRIQTASAAPAELVTQQARPMTDATTARPMQVATATNPPTTAIGAQNAILTQARAYFVTEAAEQSRLLETLTASLGVDRKTLPGRCEDLAKSQAAPGAEGGMMLRLCRSWSYAEARPNLMFALDSRLAAEGDKDAETRVSMHRLIGNDRVQAAQ